MAILFRQVPLDEPAQYVAIHPVRWHDRGHPTAAFVETNIDEDEIERLRKELCDVTEQLELAQHRLDEAWEREQDLLAQLAYANDE